MARIGIDGRPFQTDLTGTGRYVFELCRALDGLLLGAEFFVYSNRPISLPAISDRWRFVDDTSSIMAGLPSSIWYLERVGTLAKRDSIDVFWGCANYLPRGLGSCRNVLTVLDLVPQLYPETMSFKHRLFHNLYFSNSLARADRLVTISQGSRHRIAQTFGKSVDAVVYPCVSEQFGTVSPEEVKRVRNQFGLRDSFLLAVATLEPRKNLTALIDALILLKAERQIKVPDLVLVGQAGWKARALSRMIAKARSAGVRIVLTGFVSDRDLRGLYAASAACVFPSVYEGFGMPVLEALACGTHVLASDVPEIREAGAAYATYFEPTTEGIARAVEQFMKSCNYRSPDKTTADRTLDHASTWAKEADKLAKVIKSVL